MVIGLFGENCTGKSAIAAELKQRVCSSVYTGKDYLRLKKNGGDAKLAFADLLCGAQNAPGCVIYVVSEPEELDLLPDRAIRVLVTAELSVIKERFAARTGGSLSAPVAAMLEKKHGSFDRLPHALEIKTGETTAADAAAQIVALMDH